MTALLTTHQATAPWGAWLHALKLGKQIVGRRVTMPVLATAKVEPATVSGLPGMRISITNLEQSAVVEVQTYFGPAEPFLIPINAVHDVLRGLHGSKAAKYAAPEPVTITVPMLLNFKNEPVYAEHLTVAGFGREVKVETIERTAIDDFVKLPSMHGPMIGRSDALQLFRAFDWTATAAGKDDTLPMLTGVKVDVDRDQLHLAATDRYRLTVADFGIERTPRVRKAQLLVPAPFGKLVKLLRDDVTIRLNKQHLIITDDPTLNSGFYMTTTVITRLMDASFPAYKALIPSEATWLLTNHRSELIQDVMAAKAACSRNEPVHLTISTEAITVEGCQPREASLIDGEPFDEYRIGFNPQFLIDVLKGFREHVSIGITAPTKPHVFEGEVLDPTIGMTGTHVLMPVRLPA